MDHGLGRHIWVAPPDAALVWAKGLFISEVCYTVIICSNRFSVLAFYWRIFKPSKIRIPIYLLVASVSAWGIAVVGMTTLPEAFRNADLVADTRDYPTMSTSERFLD